MDRLYGQIDPVSNDKNVKTKTQVREILRLFKYLSATECGFASIYPSSTTATTNYICLWIWWTTYTAVAAATTDNTVLNLIWGC